MNKKKLVSLCIVVAMVLTAIAGGTLAYFTDEETATNTFTVGNVDIQLEEPSWKDGAIADPGVAVAKDPIVKNIGDNEAWVRVNVTLSDAAAFEAAAAAHQITDLSTVFAGHDEGKWQLQKVTRDAEADTITYSYYYKAKLAAGADTGALFTSVTVPAAFTSDEMAAIGDDFTITVTADAIQTSGLATVEAAFAAFDAE